jgi:hypothetical protein
MQPSARYFAQFRTVGGRWGSLPAFPRFIVSIFALPGIVLLLLSILLGIVSIFVLLLLTVPVYRLLAGVFGVTAPTPPQANADLMNPFFGSLFGQPGDSPGRRQVQATVTDAKPEDQPGDAVQ